LTILQARAAADALILAYFREILPLEHNIQKVATHLKSIGQAIPVAIAEGTNERTFEGPNRVNKTLLVITRYGLLSLGNGERLKRFAEIRPTVNEATGINTKQ
jgi:hypothetical protein